MSTAFADRRSFMDLDAEINPDRYDPEPPPPPDPLPPDPIKRREIAGFIRVIRPVGRGHEDMWWCDCYCGSRDLPLRASQIHAEREREHRNDGQGDWYMCPCGYEMDELPNNAFSYWCWMALDHPEFWKNTGHPVGSIPIFPKYKTVQQVHIVLTFPIRKKGNRTAIPAALRRAILIRDNFTCQHCGSTEDLTIDHIIPVANDGPTTYENSQVLCRPCNSRKGAR
jgi:hypothetical protein